MNRKILYVLNILIVCCLLLSCRSNEFAPKKFKQVQQKASQGDLYAQFLVASAYYHGRGGLSRDSDKGFKMMKDLASKGYAQAQDSLGCFYIGKQNYRDGVRWVKKAAEEGNDSTAQWRLGAWYEYGDCGLRKSDAMAEYWYRKSVDQGNFSAKWALDRLLWK